MKRTAIILIMIAGIFIAGCSSKEKAFESAFDGSMDHVHGMGYVKDDGGLYLATHTGLKIYRDGEWFETTKNFNDYMGFNAVDKGFYTSGHPGEDSDLPNPIGLKRSFDGGRTLEDIDFEGESDFHVMAVGYNSHDIILMNETKNTKLGVGFYKSKDNGDSWEEVEATGLEGDILGLSMHPTNSAYIAAATSNGVYISSDGGATFNSVTPPSELGTAVLFDEENLYYASYGTDPKLMKRRVETGEQEELNLPDLTEDGPVFIAQNPKDDQEFAFYTMKGQAYLSKDAANSWEQIVEDGKVK